MFPSKPIKDLRHGYHFSSSPMRPSIWIYGTSLTLSELPSSQLFVFVHYRLPVTKIRFPIQLILICIHFFTFSFVYNHLKLQIIVFCYLRISLSYVQREQVLFHEVSHVALPVFYSGPERTNQTMTLEVRWHTWPLQVCVLSFAVSLGPNVRWCSGVQDRKSSGLKQKLLSNNLTSFFVCFFGWRFQYKQQRQSSSPPGLSMAHCLRLIVICPLRTNESFPSNKSLGAQSLILSPFYALSWLLRSCNSTL